MADVPESTNPVRIALEDVTPVIAAAFANDTCLIWSGEWQAYWRDGGHGYTKAADQAGLYTIEAAYARTRHCDPTKQIAFERIDATRAAPPAMDREAVVEAAAISLIVDLCGPGASQSATNVRVVEDHLRQFASTLSADAIRQGDGDQRGFCNKCGFAGVPQKGGFHYRPKDGQPCNYICTVPATPASHASDGGISHG